jgi:ABC-type bacteriocin/lantibiotic exporter with double-glycine peptidase domain
MQFLNSLFLRELDPLLQLGSTRPLEITDVGQLEENERVEKVSADFKRHWADVCSASITEGKTPSLWLAFLRTCGLRKQLIGVFLSGCAAGGTFGPPLILRALSMHFTGQESLERSTLWILVALLFVVPLLSSILSAQSYVIFSHTATVIRSAVIPEVFEKAIKISNQAKLKYNTGQITNLFSNDINQIVMFFQMFADTFFSPFQLGVALALVYREVGIAMFAGLGVVVAMLPLLIVRAFDIYRCICEVNAGF